ncbi:N-acetylgalactosamine kinase-like [Uloborus diversus]|uniref:N-acetylgalactosamine kinase-like n=1 Tax=Uloborus diversus TaxID=327109 RepID=UPI00240927F2|nr:N-acetylgalactosamine kinase-like [Uloborus diversus]
MSANGPPVFNISDSPSAEKYLEIEKYFKSNFSNPPKFYARVPGRVNLIGEHIDYCGFSVLPMALEQDIVLAVGTNDANVLNIINFDSERYESFSTSVQDLHIDTSCPHWYHYFLCGYKGISEKYVLKRKGLNVVVKGSVPPSAGLSSSSALVCASALATGYANGISISKVEYATLCAESEKYIGTQGGGMDQSIGFLAESGTAKHIEFNPLRTTNVPLPKGVAFVVSNSCVAMNKAATSEFNTRVLECKLAAKVLAKLHGFEWQTVEKLAEIPFLLKKDLPEMKDVIDSHLSSKLYSRQDICCMLDIESEQFQSFLSKNTQHLEKFQLGNRAQHVFQEAYRVRQFKLISEEGGDNTVHELGRLMNESHVSCRDLYECSHPVLDDLVQTALESGAIGSRLTGAGWGGCCVSLVMENRVEEFLQMMKKKFYDKRGHGGEGTENNTLMFPTKPSAGAAIYST